MSKSAAQLLYGPVLVIITFCFIAGIKWGNGNCRHPSPLSWWRGGGRGGGRAVPGGGCWTVQPVLGGEQQSAAETGGRQSDSEVSSVANTATTVSIN